MTNLLPESDNPQDLKPISNHPNMPTVKGSPIYRWIEYQGHGHDKKQKIIQIRVSRIHRIEQEVDGVLALVPLPLVAPDDNVILEANMNRYVDQNGIRVAQLPATYDDQGVELVAAHYPLNSIQEYIYWYYAFTLPQVLWSVLDENIIDQASKGAFDNYTI